MELLKPSKQEQQPYNDRPDDSSIMVRLPRIHVPYGVRLVVGSVMLTVAVLSPFSATASSPDCAPARHPSSHHSRQPWEQRAEVLLGAALLARRGASAPHRAARGDCR